MHHIDVLLSLSPCSAARAEEHDLEDALVKDPLAKPLAGKRALAERQVRGLPLPPDAPTC
jgi:hypothetical protein